MTQRIKVVYVVGVSRSGSTVTSAVLGAHPSVCFVGEIAFTPYRGWEGERVCSCGRVWNECTFWSAVRRHLDASVGGFNVEEYRILQRKYEPYLLDWRGWARLQFDVKSASGGFARYSELTAALFESVRRASGKSIIVDSSKDPGRALALAKTGVFDLTLVHVVRDARGVAFSMAKSFQRDASKAIYHSDPGVPVLRSAALWSLINGASELVGRALPPHRSVRIRYEDFISNPERELDRVGERAGLDYSSVADAVRAGEPLPTGHLLNGNRMRMASGVRLQPDLEWKRALRRVDRLKVDIAAAPMLLRYGY